MAKNGEGSVTGWLRLRRSLLWTAAAAAALVAATAQGGRAQERGAVSGRVLSTVASERGEPVPGVTVRLAELRRTGISDEGGRFELTGVPAGAHELRAELLGCLLASRTVEVRADETSQVELRVSQPVIELPGVVATGIAAEAPPGERPYAVGEVDVAERAGHPGRSIADLIRGEFPGVRILERGQAGGEISIQLRGPTSISGSQHPLLVIDGIITSGGFVDLNPRDVAHVRVLKGAAAAAEYGARGEAGVIEVTTIQGAGEAVGVTKGPVVVVDGELSERGLGPVDSERIQDLEMLTGARAGVLFGRAAEQRGVLRVTTKAAAERDREGLTRCIRPPG